MKKGKSILTRCLALALALVLIVSGANLSAALKVSANSEKTYVTVGELVAKNYELAEWEEALLNTGFFGEDYSYTTPTADDNLVAINGDAKKISAKSYEQWIPVSADIMVDNQSVETVAINNNEGTYAYDGEIFSVAVKYELNYEVSAAEQQKVLNTITYLLEGLENAAVVKDADSSLEIIEEALPTLEYLCEQSIGGVKFGDDFVKAVKGLKADMEANEGMLGIRYVNKNYYKEGTQFLVLNVGTYEVSVPELYEKLVAIANDPLTVAPSVDSYLTASDKYDGTNYAFLWSSFKGVLNTLIEKLEPVSTADAWHVNEIQSVNASISQFAELDALLANAGESTAVSYKTTLKEAETVVHATQNMNSVFVSVELKVVEDIPGSVNLVSGGKAGRTFLTLPQGASAEEVMAAVKASGVEADAKAAWGAAYADEHFEASFSELPEKLTEDITLVITYAPKSYTVTYSYQDAKQVPYGYTQVLDYHTDATKAYDYIVNGKSYMAGLALQIVGDTEISRTEGKAYRTTTAYTVIGQNYGNQIAQAILSSGAIAGDTYISYRIPETVEEISGKLLDGTLNVAASYNADYEGLVWVPYTYGNEAEGTKEFSGSSVSGYTARQAQVDYILKLNNISAADAAAALSLAQELKTEAGKQKAGMDMLANYYDDIGTLNKSYLDALLGTINGFDFTPGDGENGYNNYDDAENLAMRAYFAGIVNALLSTKANYIDRSNNNLMLYTMLTEYKNGGLAYYYKNSDEISKQVSDLAGYLTGLVGDTEKEAALALLLEEMGKAEFIEKIAKLGQAMTDIKANLLPTNEAIDVNNNAGLLNLAKAVTASGEVETKTAGVPYIVSNKITVVDESAIVLIANIYVDGEVIATVTTAEYDRGTKLSQAMIDELQAKIDAEVAKLGEKLPYYTVSGGAADLAGKIGVELDDNLTVAVNCNEKQYIVKIEGQADQIVTINDLEIELPQHENHPSTVYEYTVKGEATRVTSYVLEVADLDALFVNGTYTIAVETIEVGKQMLQEALNKLNSNSAGNTYEIVDGTLIANIAGTGDGMLAFAKGLLDTGYGYIGVNGKPMMYGTEEGLEISLQALLDAMVEDKDFGSQTLIDLGNNGQGKILSAELQLGIDSELLYEDAMPFVLNLTSVPEQMSQVAKGLKVAENNFSFKSNGDHVFVYVNLPEKVYEIYLTAMLGTSELDRSDINAINNRIALMFLYDYAMLIAESDVTAMTFENTLRIFDEVANEVLNKDIPDYDIAAYDKYLQLVKKALTSEGVVVNADETTMSLSVTGQGKHLLTLADGLGFNLDAYRAQLGMIKEFKEGNTLTGKVIATLANTAVDFEALVLDLNAGIDGAKEVYNVNNRSEVLEEAIDMVKGMGLANAIDYTDDLPARAAEITGKAAIMLLDDVDGDLTFNDTTILDLNGKTINGNLIANGHVYIMDSTLDTANAGSITGSVSGNVTIVAGNYNANVAAYLPDGYMQVNGNVRNALYTIESPNGGDLIVTVNGDVYMEECVDGYLPSARALAADIAVDLAFNYNLAAKLSVDSNTIYNIDFDDLVGFIDSNTKRADFVNQVLSMVDAKGTSNVINAISADLLDFAAIEQALINGTEIVSYDLTVAPYGVELDHVVDGDYVTINLGSVESHAKTVKIALKTESGLNTDRLIKVVGELADIVVAENTYAIIDLEQPTYTDGALQLTGSGKASLDVDLSKNADYQTIIAVVLAYGIPEKADDLVNAIGDSEKLKLVFNTITVKEAFDALKALEREINFTQMAESLGVEIDVTNAAAKERVVHLALSAFGYLLEKMDINGYGDKTLGMLEEGNSGRYTLTKSAYKAGDITGKYVLNMLDGKEVGFDKIAERLGVEINYSKVADYEELIKNNAYRIIIAVSEAYNNADEAENLLGVIKDQQRLEKYIDAIPVERILKALESDVSFAEKAMKLEVEIDFDKAAEYEVLARVLKAAAKLTLDASAMVEHVTLSVKIFPDDCLWGDANHDGVVDAMDATLVLQYHVDSLAEGQFFCTKRTDVNGDGAIDAMDATLILQHFVGTITKFPVED